MRALTVLLLSLAASLCFAGEKALEQLNILLANPTAQPLAYAAGQERISFCQHCHGTGGNSTRPDIPNLAAQNPVYLFNTFEQFATGQRTDFVMSKLAKTLSVEDRVNIAFYYGQQKVVASPAAAPHLHEKGQAQFQQTCQSCHGAKGEGQDDMPRLAGQPAEYIIQTLKNFRSEQPSRTSPVMLAITKNMSDEDIHSVASYIQALEL